MLVFRPLSTASLGKASFRAKSFLQGEPFHHPLPRLRGGLLPYSTLLLYPRGLFSNCIPATRGVVLPRTQFIRWASTNNGGLEYLTHPTTSPEGGKSHPRKEETPVEKAIREAKEASSSTIGDSPVPSPLITSVSAETVTPVSGTPPSPTSVATSTPIAVKKSVWARVKEEAVHYWHGSKLLGKEAVISFRLLGKLLRNKDGLTRREQRQLKRTLTDLLRLVPFVIIVLIPFLELALPLLLRFFPNMLPSTFESKYQEEEKRKKILKMRLEMARFLQETVSEVAVAGTAKAAAAKEFNDFFDKYRTTGELAPSDEIIKIAKKFEDQITLNNLSRPQLVSMAKYMNINAFGTDSFLRSQIDRRLKYLRTDDTMIQNEGVHSQSLPELIQICQSRGIQTIGVSPARMRSELEQWLDLHVNQRIPSSILILSRAFQMGEDVPLKDKEAARAGKAEALQATLSSLPHQVVNEAKLKVSEAEGVATYKQKLEVLKEQEELIEDELEQEAAAKGQQEAAAAEISAAAPDVEYTTDAPPVGSESSSSASLKEEELSSEELKKLGEALKTMTTDSSFEDVKAELADLQEDRKEYKEDIIELEEVTHKHPAKVTDTLGSRVDKMLSKIEQELAKHDKMAAERAPKMMKISPNDQGDIAISDLEVALGVIKDHPNDERIKRIVQRLDKDGDGFVALKEILDLAETERSKEGHGKIVTKEVKEQ